MNEPFFPADEPGFPNEGLLRAGLTANATFSALCGLALLVFYEAASGLLGGLDPTWLNALGASLLVFAAVVAIVASSSPLNPVAALVISIADVGWVLGSGVVIAVWGDVIGGTGKVIVALVAIAVAGFATTQLAGLRRYASNAHGRTDARSRFDFVQQVPASAGVAWSRIRDIDRIGEFYTDLTQVHVEEKDGVLRRTCGTDDAVWSEEVRVLDDEKRELVLEFDLSGGGLPVPAVEMMGGWVVTPAGTGSSIRLWYEYTLRWGWAGEILAATLSTFYRRQLGPVIDAIGTPDPTRVASEW